MKLPAILNGHTLTEIGRIYPERMGISDGENGTSTVSMVVTAEEPQMTPGAWVKVTTPQGKVIIMQVKSSDDDIFGGKRTVALEHLWNILKDEIIFGEVKARDMGASGDTISAADCVRYILNQQAEQNFTLGTCDYSDAFPFSFNNITLQAGILTVVNALENSVIEFDFSVKPFKIHIRRRTDTVGCELRQSRNMTSLKRRIDKTGMYTRLYPVGNKNIHIGTVNDGQDYVEKNTQIYGTISKVETDQTKKSPEVLKAWAQGLLDKHCEPIVTITISGQEWSEATGEPLDRITLGTMCRCPLPEYNTTIVERVTKVTWNDALKEPESIIVTLANNPQDVASIINQMKSGGGGGAGAQAKDAEEDHAWLVDTTEKAGMIAVAVAGKTETGEPNWSRMASFYAERNIADDTVSIQGRVTTVEGTVVAHESHFEMTDSMIRQEVVDRTNAVNDLSGAVLHKTERIQTATDILDLAYDYTDELETTIEGTALWQNKDHINAIAGTFEKNGNTVRLIDGASLEVKKNGVYSTVGTVTEINTVDTKVQSIQGSALWTQRDHITGVVGEFTKSGDVLTLKNGAELRVTKNGVVSTVGTVTEIGAVGSRVSTIEGSALWTNRNGITAVTGLLEKDSSGNLVVKDGAGLYVKRGSTEYGVFDNGNLSAGIIVSKINGGTVKINSAHIELNGDTVARSLESKDISVGVAQAMFVVASQDVTANKLTAMQSVKLGSYDSTWQSQQVVTSINRSAQRYFLYTDSLSGRTPTGTVYGTAIFSMSTKTIYYLGRNE